MIDLDKLESRCKKVSRDGDGKHPVIASAESIMELISRLRYAESEICALLSMLRHADKDASRYRWKSEKYDEILSHASSGDDVAVSIDGDVYHHVAMTYEMAEDAECVSMCLDDAGVPDCDENGVRYSLWGRVSRFSTYSTPCDEIGAAQCK